MRQALLSPGVGASAGGLEAFKQMLSALPVDTGMAFVLVQHLSPTHDSQLAEILSRTTAMPVTEVQDEPRVVPNRVYVIPPGRDMVIAQGALQLFPRSEARGPHRPVDLFFRSLAEDQKHRAIGVILSGTASDGTLGLEEIKAEGGITFTQDDSAQQNSMPRSAVATGCVDFVLPPDEIARELGHIAQHPYVAPATPAASAGDSDLGEILEILLKVTGVDLSQYKKNTLYRDSFEAVDARHRLYARKPAARRFTLGHAAGFYRGREEAGAPPSRSPQDAGWADLQKQADRILWARYVPPAVLVNANLEILQLCGDTGPYLSPAPGKASLNLLKMVRDGLLVRLRAVVNRARNEGAPTREEGLLVKSDGGIREVNLEVVPVRTGSEPESGFLVLSRNAGQQACTFQMACSSVSTVLGHTAAAPAGSRKRAAPHPGGRRCCTSRPTSCTR